MGQQPTHMSVRLKDEDCRLFADMFDTCGHDIVAMSIQVERGINANQGDDDLYDTLCRDPMTRLGAISRMLDNLTRATSALPRPPATIELLLCELMHQISMCIAGGDERAMLVRGFRSMFAKQVAIATMVAGPAIARREWDSSMDSVVTTFARYGCVPAVEKVPNEMALYIDERCRELDPRVWGGEESQVRMSCLPCGFVTLISIRP